MNQTDITGIPDFVIAAKLTSLAHDLFDYDKWIQPTQLDEDTHELIQSMHDVGLVEQGIGLAEQGIGLADGVQIVCYRLKESV